jgi:hypothetical protein
LVRDREPIFDEDNTGSDQHPLELWHGAKEFLAICLGAKSHNPFDADPVVPAAVEQDDFPGCRQMGRIALKIPMSAFALGGRGQRHNLADARVQPLGHTLDYAALACGVTALEQQKSAPQDLAYPARFLLDLIRSHSPLVRKPHLSAGLNTPFVAQSVFGRSQHQ